MAAREGTFEARPSTRNFTPSGKWIRHPRREHRPRATMPYKTERSRDAHRRIWLRERSSALSTAVPSAGSDSISSRLAAAMPSIESKFSICAAAHVGHHARVGAGDIGQTGGFLRRDSCPFQSRPPARSRPAAAGTKAGQRGYSGCPGSSPSGNLPRQHLRDDVLGGGFPGAAGHRHQAATPALPRPRGQLLECLKRVLHPQNSAFRRRASRNLAIHDHGRRAFPEDSSDECMPIMIWPP